MLQTWKTHGQPALTPLGPAAPQPSSVARVQTRSYL